jgi:lactate racemase
MLVELAYGQSHLPVQVPDGATVLRPKPVPGLPDDAQAIRDALRNPFASLPLRARVKPTDQVVILFSDITRPMPSDRVLPVLLDELSHVPRERVTLINAVGTHRANTPAELERMLGADIVRDYRILQHNAWDDANLANLGVSLQGHPLSVNRTYLCSTFKILTGYIQPHIFAGYSGGPKAVLPGVAGFNTIMANHSYAMLNDPRAAWGVTAGNPIWEEMRELALLTQPDFLLNVTANRERQICAVFAGALEEAHKTGINYVRETAMTGFAKPFDIVITSNDGYPADINLYQSVKGMSCAAQIVKRGGAIIMAAECRDGVPENGQYRKLVRQAGSVAGINKMLSRPGFCEYDQWQVQLQGNVLSQAEVFVHSQLDDSDVREMLFRPCRSIEETLNTLLVRYGPNARVCVLPEGAQVIPYLTQ